MLVCPPAPASPGPPRPLSPAPYPQPCSSAAPQPCSPAAPVHQMQYPCGQQLRQQLFPMCSWFTHSLPCFLLSLSFSYFLWALILKNSLSPFSIFSQSLKSTGISRILENTYHPICVSHIKLKKNLKSHILIISLSCILLVLQLLIL